VPKVKNNENFAILRSIIDTTIKNNQNVVETLSVIAETNLFYYY